MSVGLARKFGLDILAGHRTIMALEADAFFRLLHQPLRHLWRVRTMATFTPVISYPGVAGMRALDLRVAAIFGRARRKVMHRGVPADFLMAGKAHRRRLVRLHQEFARNRVGIFLVRIMAVVALQLAAFVQPYRIKA